MIKYAALLLVVLSIHNCKKNNTKPEVLKAEQPQGIDNVAYQWGKMALKATANDTERFKPRPTVTSRFLGLIFTSTFDAWSRYTKTATPVYASNIKRRPIEEFTLKNKQKAVSYAAYHSLTEYYPADSLLFKQLMKQLGYNPNIISTDETSPEGIGYLAAEAVIKARIGDGSNQYGEVAGSNNLPYFDYTEYKPINSADKNTDIDRWQPKYFSDGKGGKFAPGCLTPFWGLVKPITLKSADQFRPGPPPRVGSKQLEEEVAEVVALQANLTDAQKALVEFMRDGPQSVQQAGHWLKFAQDVSRRDQHTLDQDVKMYFYNQIVAMDAFIASWDSKMYYDSARPYAQVHYYFKDKDIIGWGGENKGFIKMKGQYWRPYSPEIFLCPPFPSYVSGHSTISGACGEALKLWTGNDRFGESVELVAGAMTEPEHLGKKVTLTFPTFTETAEMAGISRVLGGYHIQADNVAGLKLGRDVAHEAWKFYQNHINVTKDN